MLKKILIILAILLLIVTGIVLYISRDSFDKAYEKMNVGKNGINGYKLDLRVISANKSKSISLIMNIENYMNDVYKITEIDIETQRQRLLDIFSGKKIEITDAIYINDNVVYKKDTDNKYKVSNDNVKYTNSKIYLEGLKYVKKTERKSKEKLGGKSYKVYDVVYEKEVTSLIAKYLDFDDVYKTVPESTGKIYINSNGYIYKIIYYIEDITVRATYYDIDNIKRIVIPNN